MKEFQGAVEVSQKDITKALKNFTKRKSKEIEDIDLEFSKVVQYYRRPRPSSWWGSEDNTEISFKEVVQHYLKESYEDGWYFSYNATTVIKNNVLVYLGVVIRSKDETLLSKGIPKGLSELQSSKANTAFLNPTQSCFVEEYK